MKLPDNLSIETIMQTVDDDSCTGFCLSCGNEQFGVEPDARNYECEACGKMTVLGAEEILIMIG